MSAEVMTFTVMVGWEPLDSFEGTFEEAVDWFQRFAADTAVILETGFMGGYMDTNEVARQAVFTCIFADADGVSTDAYTLAPRLLVP